MILFARILEAIEVCGGPSDWYEPDDIPAEGKEDIHPAPELLPSAQDENYGESIEL